MQAGWRGAHARSADGRAAAVVRERRRRRTWLLLAPSRLHASSAHDVTPAPPARMALQALARGFLVRRRAAAWRAQQGAAVGFQAAWRGFRARRRVATPKLERRVARLESQLRAERKARELQEVALRHMWRTLFPAAVEAGEGGGVAV